MITPVPDFTVKWSYILQSYVARCDAWPTLSASAPDPEDALADLMWGLGYSHAQDRGMQMLMMRILGRGTAADQRLPIGRANPYEGIARHQVAVSLLVRSARED